MYNSSAQNNNYYDFYLKGVVYTKGTDKQARVVYSFFDVIH